MTQTTQASDQSNHLLTSYFCVFQNNNFRRPNCGETSPAVSMNRACQGFVVHTAPCAPNSGMTSNPLPMHQTSSFLVGLSSGIVPFDSPTQFLLGFCTLHHPTPCRNQLVFSVYIRVLLEGPSKHQTSSLFVALCCRKVPFDSTTQILLVFVGFYLSDGSPSTCCPKPIRVTPGPSKLFKKHLMTKQ